ncbi:leukocyte receptor cluster member 9 isoform X2 [Channa argus]|uniref:leukocyte receptor cluster member 9 isoform X2 n=1 Tax=Channa argus TaxID=215402 RepID=UPI002945839E|nr:hypothetical protein Q8A73_007868 [Channa argus]
MASDGPGIPSDSPEDQRQDRAYLKPTSQTDTPGRPTEVPADPNSVSAVQDDNGVSMCQFFLKGKCHFGHRCRLFHSDPPLDDSGAASPDQDDELDEEKLEKKKKKGKVNKATKPKYNEGKEANKKPRMRTADDVISRILWDPLVSASEFVVGYLDRFLGVLERPFCDFNWETNPCDCDYSAELALPRHRIQYFTYRGHRVWDRHSRTDRVFGSTGQTLAPPFGGEEEVKEDREQQQECLKTTKEWTSAVCGQEENEAECTHTESTHLEEEKTNEMNIHTPGTTQLAPKCRGKISQEQQESQGACVEEEAPNRLHTSADQKEGVSIKQEVEEEEWEESWESKEDVLSHVGVVDSCQNPLAPREQRGKTPGGGRPPKKQPTHFITFRANTPAVLSCFQQLQEEITSILPSSAPHWQKASCLHVTLCLLVLPSPAEVATAGEILRRFAHLDRNPPVAVTFPVKLKHFNGRVLFLSPQPQLHLHQLNSGLQEAYRKKGLLHRDSYSPRYHLTLAKLNWEEEKIFEGVGDLKVGKGLNFGRLPVNTLHLCSIGGSKVDGFYETVCTVTLR